MSNEGQIILGRKTNYLLMKDDVGKCKPPTRALPGSDFVYGKAGMGKDEGGSAATMVWQTTARSVLNNARNPRNF